MFRFVAVLGFAGLIVCACTSASSTPTSTPANLSAGPTATPPHACGGFGVPLMRIHIAADGSSIGDLLNTNAGDSVTRTSKLVWPDGYSVRTEGGVLVLVNATGQVMATDGSTLANVQVCPEGDVLLVSEPIVLASSSP